MIDFARDVLATPLDPWEELAVIHGGELLPDGRPRFRVLLILVARQNGKTLVARVLTLFWLFMERGRTVLNTSTDRSYAKRFWSAVCAQAKASPWLAPEVAAVRLTISEESMTTTGGAELVFAANNGRAGRSMTLHRWICDELREHDNWECWNAAKNAQNAVYDAQTVCITNQGDASAVVLDSLRASALAFMETGEGDARLGLLEWSAEDGCDPLDVRQLAMANPNLNRRLDAGPLLGDAARAVRAGGEELTKFRTEVLCQRVRQLDPAVDPGAWARCLDPGDLAGVRARVACALDVSPDQQHATLVAAALLADGRTRIEAVTSWSGPDTAAQVARELPSWLVKVKPQAFGWLPSGPAAALATSLADRKRRGWPPPGVTVEEVRGDLAAVCMGFAARVASGQVAHSGDPLIDAHVGAAERLKRGDTWVFSRKGDGHCDAAYAAAAADHLARTLPAPVGKLRLVMPAN
ncbi:MAG: terminase [Chloroflexota bacterium]